MLANIRTRFPRSRLSASGNKFSAPFYLSTRYEWIRRGYSIVPGNNEGKSWFAKRTLLRHSHAPNHALNQAKLRPQIERNYYHDSACCASGSLIASNVVIQIRGKSLFHCGLRFATPGCVIHYLVTPDLADPEIFCLGMREIKAAHARTGVHCKRFS
jgi:hypothetical protein